MGLMARSSAARPAAAKPARLEVRTTADQKRLIERAAELKGTSLSEFVNSNLNEAATATIKEFESLFLRDEAREAFVLALLNPPEPNEALKAAAARHKQLGL